MDTFVKYNPDKQPKCKVELHAHLDGCVRLTTIWDLAKSRGVSLPASSEREFQEACCIREPTTLPAFLQAFDRFSHVIVGDGDGIERVAYEFCEDVAQQGVVYSEVRYSPHLLCGPGLTPSQVVVRVSKSLKKGAKDFGITVRSILCCIRTHPEWSSDVVELCNEFKSEGVVGIDIAGDETKPLSPLIIDAFQRALSLGIHRTAHAGEAAPAASVLQAVRELGAERIGHGYRVLDDPGVYALCREAGTHFEVCPHSSCLTGAVPLARETHPIVRFAEDNINFSISRDDSTVIQKTLDEECDLLRSFGMKDVHMARANFNAARSCFLPDDEKQLLLKKLMEAYGIL